MNIPDNHILVSFDVVNCFGEIPTQLAIDIISRDFELIQPHTNIPKKEFLELLTLCLHEANYFGFQNTVFRQLKGMFMGSSLAPILVERVIEEAVLYMMNKTQPQPVFWYTYVDDHLTCIPRNQVEAINTLLNEYHPDVKFTVELQDDDNISINFLDTTVYNKQGKIITNWYHKPIASNRLLNFYSAHPRRMIKNTATAFAKRVLRLSHASFKDINIERITKILSKNNFPMKVIKHIISSAYNTGRHNDSQRRSQRVTHSWMTHRQHIVRHLLT